MRSTIASIIALSLSTGSALAQNQTSNASAVTNQSNQPQSEAQALTSKGLYTGTDNPAQQSSRAPTNPTNPTSQAKNITQAGDQTQGNTMTLVIQQVTPDQQVTAGGSEGKLVQFSASRVPISMGEGGPAKEFTELKSGQRIKVTYSGSKVTPEVSKIEIQG
jgi:hypothetical protein